MIGQASRRRAAFGLAATLVLAACGSSSDDANSTTATSTITAASGATASAAASGASGTGASAARVTTTRPLSATGPDGYGVTDCPPASGAVVQVQSFPAPFKRCIDATKAYTATITTNKGVLTAELLAKSAPLTVNNFVALARNKYFDGISCHRIIPKFVAQCGDPTGKGSGGPGYKFNDELPASGSYKVGSLAMANAGPNTNGSQFFIITGADGAALPANYALFGQAIGSEATIKALDAAGNPANNGVPPKEAVSIVSVTITEK